MNSYPIAAKRRISGKLCGFTLVELLVVIGIIALLISILLPALNKARKSAVTLKCASALREIGHAYEMYASDNRGWWPPGKLATTSPTTYGIDNTIYQAWLTTGTSTITYVGNTPQITLQFPCYWYNFVSKYVTRYQIGTGDSAVGGNGQAQTSGANGSVFWGCPEWQGYSANREDQMGYGVNNYPTMTPSHPLSTSLATSFPDSSVPATGNYYESTLISGWTSGDHGSATTSPAGDFNGSFYQQKDYRNPSDRALIADSIFWITTSYYIAAGDTPFCAPALTTNNNSTTPTATEGMTWADFYRHGVYPRIVNTTSGGGHSVTTTSAYDPNGGKVGYNILFCDGHVITSNQKSDAFKYFRMRYPG